MSEHKKTAVIAAKNEGMVIGGGKRYSYIRPRVKMWILLALGVVVLVVAGFGVYKLTKHKSNIDASRPQNTTKPLTPTEKAEQTAYTGNYAGAQKILDGQQASAADKQAKASLYSQQVVIALNVHDYADANTYAQKAEAIDPTPSTAHQLGYVADLQSDKQTAMKYYQLAIDRQTKLPQTPANQLILMSYKNDLTGVANNASNT